MNTINKKVAEKYFKEYPFILDFVLDFLVTPEILFKNLGNNLLRSTNFLEESDDDRKVYIIGCYPDPMYSYNGGDIYKTFFNDTFVLEFISFKNKINYCDSENTECKCTLCNIKTNKDYDLQYHFVIFNDVSYTKQSDIKKSCVCFPVWLDKKIGFNGPVLRRLKKNSTYHTYFRDVTLAESVKQSFSVYGTNGGKEKVYYSNYNIYTLTKDYFGSLCINRNTALLSYYEEWFTEISKSDEDVDEFPIVFTNTIGGDEFPIEFTDPFTDGFTIEFTEQNDA